MLMTEVPWKGPTSQLPGLHHPLLQPRGGLYKRSLSVSTFQNSTRQLFIRGHFCKMNPVNSVFQWVAFYFIKCILGDNFGVPI